MTSFNSVAVIGAGAWGTALAGVAARAGRSVTLYARNTEAAAQMKSARSNPRLPGVRVDERIQITGDIATAAQTDIVLIATPAQHLREAVKALAPHLKKAVPVIAAAKGIERGTHKFMTEVIVEAAPHATPAILSGPSFADDVARGLPTAVTLAAKRRKAGGRAGAGAGLVDVPSLSHDGYPRRRDRRRGKERAGDRSRHRRRTQARRLGAGRADHARLQRTRPPRAGLRRAQRNPGGPFRSGRLGPVLLQPAIAQFCAWHRLGTRRSSRTATSSPKASSPRRS